MSLLRTSENCMAKPMVGLQEEPTAERVGQTVLASQFVACLHPSLQFKVVGKKGEMEQLVLKARFEETRVKNLRLPDLERLPLGQVEQMQAVVTLLKHHGRVTRGVSDGTGVRSRKI